SGAAIGAAGPVTQGGAHLTNISWSIHEAEVANEIGAPCTLVNDVEAAAYCLPGLASGESLVIGDVAPKLETAHRLLAANIGTGFGAAILVRTPGGWFSYPSEAGHMSLPLPEDHEASLRPRFKSVEDVLSGRGLVNLHRALGNDEAALDAAEICRRAPFDPKCAATISSFTQIAGDVLGNLALAFASWDGVFLFGSVAKGFAHVADHARFREAFEAKGVMVEWMKRVPVALVEKQDAALFGLAALPMPPQR
ncbi:MAG TPA: ROK family protein, partial [Geobacterales bacterium]|nr:ROK family protein [Geobacterales bacterium]